MTTEVPIGQKRFVKMGRGLEITFEALMAIIRDRFPNIVDWDELVMHVPAMDYTPQTDVWGMYWGWIGDADKDYSQDVAGPIRRISEGAPIPTSRISLRDVYLSDGTPRCGIYHDTSNPETGPDGQCPLPLGHATTDR